MLHDRRERAGPGKHQRNVYQIEDDNPDQQTSRTAKDLPAGDAERELHDEIEKWVALQIQAEPRSPRQRQQSDVGLVLNDVEQNVREDSKPDRRANPGSANRLSHTPRECSEQNPSPHRMRVGEEIQMDRVWSDARVLDAQVTENDPQKLDELYRYKKRPEPNPRVLFLQYECG